VTGAGAGGAREEQRWRLRNDPAPPDAVTVVRGGPDSVEKLRGHARRTSRAWCLDGLPLYGVSVFCALDDVGPASLLGLLSARLMTYRVVHLTTVAALTGAGFSLLATGRRPHYTVALHSDRDDDLRRLLDRLGAPQDNQYHRVRDARPEGTGP
jgi:hypothetical protein